MSNEKTVKSESTKPEITKSESTKSDRLTPGEAKRKLCTQCIGKSQFDSKEVKDCGGNQAKTGACPIYEYRSGKRMSVKVFRKFCLQCQGGSYDGVKECTTSDCPAYDYRFGTNPVLTGRGGGNLKGLQEYRERLAGQSNNL